MTRRRIRYKGISVNLLGLPDWGAKEKKITRNTPRRQYLLSFHSDFEKNLPKNLLLIYDIPEERKKERDWFRRQLRNYSFVMIQRSVWVGPSPLPSDFLAYLKRIGLRKEFKTFKLAKPYIINQSTL